MPENFIAGRLHDIYASETDALAMIRDIVSTRDRQRPPDKQFEVKAFEQAVPIELDQGAKLLVVAELGFVIAPVKPEGVGLYGSGADMYFTTRADAEEWLEEFSSMAPGMWKIFEKSTTT